MTALVDAAGEDVRQATAAAAALLTAAEDVTLLAHVRPDADALGSALALGIALYRRGARVQVSFGAPDHVPGDACGRSTCWACSCPRRRSTPRPRCS